MKAPIHSQKHYVQISRSAVLTVAANNEPLIIAVESTVANAVDEVTEGSVVKAVYIELWTLGDGNDGSEVVTLVKTPLNNTGPTFTQMNSLGTYPNKKNILFTHQGLTPNDGITSPHVVMRGWYKIPKSKQRFGLGDRLILTIANNSLDSINYCGFATYKEYS